MPHDTTPRFYVYILSRPDGRPFYVGKGSGPRVRRHAVEARRGCECRRCRTIRKIWRAGGDFSIEIVYRTDDEAEALQAEVATIARIGRANLCNHTDGGDGTSNLSLERHPSHLYPEIRRGERQARAKFRWTDIRSIRARYLAGGITAEALAAEYHTHQTCISKIVRNETWNDPDYTPPASGQVRNIPDRKGEKSARAKVTWAVVRALRRRYLAGESTQVLEQEYDLSHTHLNRILNNVTWHDSTYQPPDLRAVNADRMRKLTPEIVEAIREQYAKGGVKYSDIARQYNISQSLISGIISRKRY